jgi:glucose/arabinose dehydrogenase
MLRFTPAGDLLVSQPRQGQIQLVIADRDGDGRSDGQRVLVDGLQRPHGLDFRGDQLYVGEGSRISQLAFNEQGPGTARVTGEPRVLVEGLPEGGNHWTHTLRFGPDGGLYLHVGSTCNVCEEEDSRRATMLRFEPDGSGEEIYASGLRNSVGFDWRPDTLELFATDNGRDLLGDDYPPCELNRITRGGFYGWPYANGDREPDPDFGEGNAERIARSIPPVHDFAAHNAPLGITFVRQPSPPPELAGAALVALHGSWNRSRKDGYKVVSLHWNDRDEIEERDFLTGFNLDDDVIGRPVDVAEGPDGAFYVSDDYAGVIYRVAAGADGSGGKSPLPSSAAPRAGLQDPLAGLDAVSRQALVSRGEALFRENACGRCHFEAEAAEGVVVKPLADLAVRYTLESMTSFFLTPQPPMPVVDLPEADRRALAGFVLDVHGR